MARTSSDGLGQLGRLGGFGPDFAKETDQCRIGSYENDLGDASSEHEGFIRVRLAVSS